MPLSLQDGLERQRSGDLAGAEAIYAAITRRYGARKLRELQDMLHALERSLSELSVGGEAGAEAGEFE